MAACRRLRERPRQDLRARLPGNAGKAVDVVAERAGAPPPSSPVKLSGSVPPLAESFHQRPETGHAARPQPGAPVTQPHQSMLWRPEAHPVLFRRGLSLDADGLTGPAIAHWQAMLAAGTRLPGAGPGAGHGAGQGGARDASAVLARDRPAMAYESAGRFGDASAAFTGALAERERTAGADHPMTRTVRDSLEVAAHG